MKRFFWLILVLAACLPLTKDGFFQTDDGIFHFYRLASLARHIEAGHFYPRWFADFAFGYGHPILNFYAPLTYYLAFLIHLLVYNPVLAMKILIVLSFVASAWAMYLLGRELWGEEAGFVASLLYTFFPYHLADVYTRGAIPEALAFVFPPLILWSWYKGYFLVGALAWAGLILTHNLSVILTAPLLFLWLLALVLARKLTVKGFAKLLLSLALGTGLAAFYWLPAIKEMGYVFIGVAGISRGYEKHLLSLTTLFKPHFFYPYTPAGTVAIHPIPLFFLLLALGGAAFLIWKGGKDLAFTLILILILALSLFMRWTGSLPIWHATERWLDSLQYPWRFLFLTAFSSSLLGGGLALFLLRWQRAWGIPGPVWVLPVLLAIPAAFLSLPLKPMPLASSDLKAFSMWETDFQNRQIGATWTAEFVPIWVKVDRTAVPLPRFPSEPKYEALRVIPRLIPGPQRFLDSRWEIETPEAIRLVWHQFYFPGWKVFVDGKEVVPEPLGPLGLLSWEVPAGKHSIKISFGDTPLRRWALTISLASALVILLWIYLESPGALKGIASGVGIILLLLALYPFKPVPHPSPASYNLENKALLLGYSAPDSIRPGSRFEVTLYWLCLESMDENYKAFVHVFDPATGRLIAQHDGDPVGGFTPTTRWLPGEIVIDSHPVVIPVDAKPGDYAIGVGLYRFPEVRNLQVIGASFPGNRILLKKVRLEEQ